MKQDTGPAKGGKEGKEQQGGAKGKECDTQKRTTGIPNPIAVTVRALAKFVHIPRKTAHGAQLEPTPSQVFKALSQTATTGSLGENGVEILGIIDNNLLNTKHPEYCWNITLRLQRTAIRIVTTIGKVHFALHGREAIRILLRTLMDFQSVAKIYNACHAALMEVYLPHRLEASNYIVAMAPDIAAGPGNIGACLVDALRSWDMRARDYMARVGLPQGEWEHLALLVNARINATTFTKDVFSPEDGFAVWTEPIVASVASDAPLQPRPLKHISWNGNGIRARWTKGDLMNVITREEPDTLHIGETKTGIDGLANPEELRQLLAMHGYKHMAFQWNTTKPKGTAKTSSGNFGSAVFSKLPLENLRFGLGHTDLDKEGRVITATIGTETFIWTYHPCSAMTKDGIRTKARERFDHLFERHYRRMVRERGGNVHAMGDFNVAPTVNDINTIQREAYGAYPSTYPEERERFHSFLANQTLSDTYAALNDTAAPDAHLSWEGSAPNGKPIKMRLDHFVTPERCLKNVLECSYSATCCGSDHRYLRVVLQPPLARTGEVTETPREDQPRRTIPQREAPTAQEHTLPPSEQRILREALEGVRVDKSCDEEICQHQPTVSPEEYTKDLERKLQLTIMRERRDAGQARATTRARWRANHHLSAAILGGRLPMLDIPIRADSSAATHVADSLVDTGASTSFMTTAMATTTGLVVTKSNETVTIGDNNAVACRGEAFINILFGNHVERVPVCVMDTLPYEFILGNDTLKKFGGIVNYRSMSLDMLFDDVEVSCPFKGGDVQIVASELTVLDAGQEHYVRAKVAVSAIVSKNMAEPGRWGLIMGHDHNDDLQVAQGIIRLKEAETTLNVRILNTSATPITIRKGDSVAIFDSRQVSLTALLAPAPAGPKEPGKQWPEYTVPQLAAWDGPALDKAIDALPHLKDLDLLNAEQLSADGLVKMKRIVLANHYIWCLEPKPVADGQLECDIQLKDNAVFDNVGHVIPTNPQTQAELRKIIEDKLNRNIIEPSKAQCSSTVLLVPKPHGGIRFCVDYRALNNKIKGDAYTLPSVDDQLSQLHNRKIFSSVDLKEAFWNVPLTAASRELTAFRTQAGLYQYRRMPMGLKTASATFCRFIDNIVGEMKWESVLVYIDDLLIATETEEQHLAVLSDLFARLAKSNLTLGAKKCFLGRKSVQFLGHVVSESGLSPDPSKVKAIEALKLPQSAKEMATAIGIMGYYRKFVLDYSTVEAPLREMRNTTHRWKGEVVYTLREKQAFEKLRDALKTNPILAHPDWSVPFELQTDASHQGLGAVLCQRIDGKEHVIAYASRAVSKTEKPWNTWELEALAMIWATRHFSMYLHNTHFTIKTDSQAARRLVAASDKDAGGRLLRWRLALQEFDFDIVHRKGKANGNADALSRMFIESDDPYDDGPTDLVPHPRLNLLLARDGGSAIVEGWGEDHWTNYEALQQSGTAWWRQQDTTWDTPPTYLCSLQKPSHYEESDSEAWTRKEWIELQHADSACSRTIASTKAKDWTEVGNYFEIRPDGMLVKKAKGQREARVVVPTALKAFIMKRYHSLPITGHKGRKRTTEAISRHYYWKGMHKDIGRWIRACLSCCKRKTARPISEGLDGIVCEAQHWMEAISIDIVETSESTEGYKYILTVIDLFSRLVTVAPLKSKRAKEVAEALFNHVFTKHGRPSRIHSDEGREFVNAGLARLYKHWNIAPVTTGGYRPWSNPVERYHRFMNSSMTMLSQRYGGDWPGYLQATAFCYNSSTCESTGQTPYYLAHGRETAMLEDLAMARVPPREGTEDVEEIAKRLEMTYAGVRAQQAKMAEANLARRRANGKAQCKGARVYEEGDSVLYWEPAQSKSLRAEEEGEKVLLKKAPGKWKPRWTGPHLVKSVTTGQYSNRYSIDHVRRKQRIDNIKGDKLRPYTPWSSAIVSTSSELDVAEAPFVVGSWCEEGALFIVPLHKPYPFGLGKVLKASTDGCVEYQWYNTEGHSATRPFKPMWWDGTASYDGHKRSGMHVPYTGKEEGTVIRQGDIVMHGFALTKGGSLRKEVLAECSKSADIWWKKRD